MKEVEKRNAIGNVNVRRREKGNARGSASERGKSGRGSGKESANGNAKERERSGKEIAKGIGIEIVMKRARALKIYCEKRTWKKRQKRRKKQREERERKKPRIRKD